MRRIYAGLTPHVPWGIKEKRYHLCSQNPYAVLAGGQRSGGSGDGSRPPIIMYEERWNPHLVDAQCYEGSEMARFHLDSS